MPRTRHEIERDEKIGEILAAAAKRLRGGGYEALSIAAIARELELAPNSVYWYFASKDHLFVAAVRQLLADLIAHKPPARRSLEGRVLWFVEQLDDLDPLRVALYERARVSGVVSAYVDELKAGSLEMIVNTLRGEVRDDELRVASETLLATIEGVRLQGLRGKQRSRVLAFSLDRLTA